MIGYRLLDSSQRLVLVQFLADQCQSEGYLTNEVYLNDSLFPCPEIEERVSIRTDEYEPDIFQYEADVRMDKSCGIEFR
jgi:hypothetical protein